MARFPSMILLALAAAGCAGPQDREPNQSTLDQVSVRLDAWVPKGDMRNTADGIKGKLDNSFDDALDLGEMVFNGTLEMWEGETGYIVRGQYLDVSGSQGSGAARSSSHLREDTVDVMVSQRWQLQDKPEDRPGITGELMGGARYRRVKNRASTGGASGSDSNDWVEPVIGGRLLLPTSDDFNFEVTGDISGFGIGSASRRTVNFFAGANWVINVSNALRFGWRVYDTDWKRGSGAGETSLDGRLSGPTAGWTFTF